LPRTPRADKRCYAAPSCSWAERIARNLARPGS
jgi:hypothetical protein